MTYQCGLNDLRARVAAALGGEAMTTETKGDDK